MKKQRFVLLMTVSILLNSCSNNTDRSESNNQPLLIETALPSPPKFNEDSAYSYIKTQVDFGPRVPGTKAHTNCADYFVSKLKLFEWEVMVQSAPITAHDGKKFTLKNIIASYKPEISNRILLLAHWDTRPFADRDTINKDMPIDGADDGASGAGILLEIARQINITKPELGIDILLDDLEDYGKENDQGQNTWCLGTQYWAKNPHKPGYRAQYGILLDMVGARNATFPREGLSRQYAPFLVKRIWNKSAHLGYSNYFVLEDVRAITDDHYYIISYANIPCVNIVGMNPVTEDFGPHHHRHSDNMSIIDKNTLKAVGQTILEVLWDEQKKIKCLNG